MAGIGIHHLCSCRFAATPSGHVRNIFACVSLGSLVLVLVARGNDSEHIFETQDTHETLDPIACILVN